MKKPKSIFYVIYLLFHVGLLMASIYVNYRSEDFEFLLWLRSKMVIMTYMSVIGLVLFIINILLISSEARSQRKEKEKLNQEVNSLKAKMFDLQEATGKKPASSSASEPSVDSGYTKEDPGTD